MRPAALILFIFITLTLSAQDTLTLFACHNLALENSPRLKDKEFIQQIGDLKVENAGANWYPSLNLNGRMSYQSDVVTIALSDPGLPIVFPEVPHDQYGLNVDVSQTLYDGGMTKQKKNLEEANTAANLQQLEVDLYGLKGKVNQFYFAVLILQENKKNLDVHMENLLKRRELIESAVGQGTMLEADLKLIDVEVLKLKRSLLEIEARRTSFLGALSVLCGEEYVGDVQLESPEFEEYIDGKASRPEYKLFELKDVSMEAGKELIAKKRMPLLYAFGQTGYGRPGYNMISGEWDYYYKLGAGLRWNIWDWNSNSRERQVISQQQQILQNQRASFEKEIKSLTVQEKAKIEQYKKSMELEEQVLDLQKEISAHAASQLAHGTITVTEYIIELNKESLARNNLATHKVHLKQSVANFLNIQGNL